MGDDPLAGVRVGVDARRRMRPAVGKADDPIHIKTMTLTRRPFIASSSAAALIARPLHAAVTPASIIDAIPGGDRMRALIVRVDGAPVVEERFSGAQLVLPSYVYMLS